MKIEGYGEVTPKILHNVPAEDLDLISTLNSGGVADTWALAERARRQSIRVGELIDSLTQTTNRVHQGIAALTLINERSTAEVTRLVKSSLTIERLTKWLVWLTVVLGLLTLVLAIDVGNRFRLEYFSPLPQLTVPRTLIPPPH